MRNTPGREKGREGKNVIFLVVMARAIWLPQRGGSTAGVYGTGAAIRQF